MNHFYVILIGLFLLFAQSVHASKVELVVHPDEKPHLLKLIDRLGLNDMELVKDNRDNRDKQFTSFGQEFGDYKDRYWIHKGLYQPLSFVTNYDNKIVKISLLDSKIESLFEIINFKELVWLNIYNSNIKSVSGIHGLQKLERIELLGSNNLYLFNGLKNLPNLAVIDIDTSKTVRNLSGLQNLPSLKEFHCRSCNINDISPLSKFTKLERLKLGGDFKSISSLKSLKSLKYLYLNSEVLQSFEVINDLFSLEELFVWVGSSSSFEIDRELPNLRYIHIVDNPLESIPDLSKTPNLERFTVTNSNLKNVDLPKCHANLKLLQFKMAKNIQHISPIKNMPKLEELSIYESPIENIEIGHLPSLKKLTLSGTNITEVKNFDHFPELTELWMMNTKVKNLEPLLDAPKLHRVMLDKTARDIPNVMLILDVLGDNLLAHRRKGGPQDARKVYEQRLSGQEAAEEETAEEQSGRSRRRSRN